MLLRENPDTKAGNEATPSHHTHRRMCGQPTCSHCAFRPRAGGREGGASSFQITHMDSQQQHAMPRYHYDTHKKARKQSRVNFVAVKISEHEQPSISNIHIIRPPRGRVLYIRSPEWSTKNANQDVKFEPQEARLRRAKWLAKATE